MNAQSAPVEEQLDELEEVLRQEFALTRARLVDALRAQREKDTPAAREWIAQHRAELDTILDVWNLAVVTTG